MKENDIIDWPEAIDLNPLPWHGAGSGITGWGDGISNEFDGISNGFEGG